MENSYFHSNFYKLYFLPCGLRVKSYSLSCGNLLVFRVYDGCLCGLGRIGDKKETFYGLSYPGYYFFSTLYGIFISFSSSISPALTEIWNFLERNSILYFVFGS